MHIQHLIASQPTQLKQTYSVLDLLGTNINTEIRTTYMKRLVAIVFH